MRAVYIVLILIVGGLLMEFYQRNLYTNTKGLITSSGVFPTSSKGVSIDVKNLGNSSISIVSLYHKDSMKGGLSEVNIVDGKWVAYFERPHQLWLFDGNSTLHLIERTVQPNGFKNSSSTKRPELWKKVPTRLKSRIGEDLQIVSHQEDYF